MAGVGEASLVLGTISSIISVIDATKQVYEAVEDEAGLPTNFKKSAAKLSLISKLLEDAERYVDNVADESIKAAFTPTLEDCKVQATHLQELFEKVIPVDGDSRWDRYMKAARTIGKGGRVESMVRGILDGLQLLATRFPEVTTSRGKDQLAQAVEEVTKMEPSLPDGFEQAHSYSHYGSGPQNINTGSGIQHINSGTGHQNSGSGQQYIGTNYIVNNHTSSKSVTIDDIDRSCLRTLRCPDTMAVKNRLKENKDKLLHKSMDWILQDPHYLSWRDGDDVCLLWIKGGAGKGKTMISIGLIERLLLPQDESTVVTYFFCQNADYELKTLDAIIKGLIFQLVSQQMELKESLRCRWDTTNERFDEDITSWRTLWNIFLEMLYRCKCPRVYVIVDALDECQDDGMADLLKLIVRTGLNYPSKIKWLLTSRPLDSAERELLAGSDQVLVSLELNSKHVSEAVKAYIAFKAAELDRRNAYGPTLRQKIQTELTSKAEDTYLWVSLVCKRLESVHRDEALATIKDLPPGLHPFYNRVLHQLSEGDSAVAKGCMRLLKVILLAYRPLNIAEVGSVSGLSDEWVTIEALVDRCASFLKMRGTDIEFVHQSTRDYLAGKNGQSILDANEYYGHDGIALRCLSHLSQRLKVNLVGLPRPDSTRELMKRNKLLASVDYAATFWVQHLEGAKRTALIQNALAEQGEVSTFLCTKLLEWLECLSLLDKLPRGIEALKILIDIADLKKNSPLLILLQDARRFLLRHYPTIVTWPLQIYSSAIVFSPQTSIVRRNNLDKLPAWLRKFPQVEVSWTSLIMTLAGHSGSVSAIAFSPDGRQIASGSRDQTIKLWDTQTGGLQQTLIGHLGWVSTIAFSPDGRQIASGSFDKTIKLWDSRTGDLQKTLARHLDRVTGIAFSPDGSQIASGSCDETIKLWDTRTGDLQKTLAGHLGCVSAIAFSPDGRQIASGSHNHTIKLWDTRTSDLQQTLVGHSGSVSIILFSPDGKQIASGSHDETIKLWDARTGDLRQTPASHLGWVSIIAFSPDGRQIALGSRDQTIKLWDTRTGDLQMTLIGHSGLVSAIVFSPDGKQIASGSHDETIKLWDTRTGDLRQTPASHSSWVSSILFSPDDRQIALGSREQTIKLCDTRTSDLQQTLAGHSGSVSVIAFSPDGKQIVSGSHDETIKFWDTRTGNLQQTLIGHSGSVSVIVFSPDGKQIASGSHDETIKLWDAQTGDLQKTFTGHSSAVTATVFSPDSRQIASGSRDETIKLWDTRTGNLQQTLIDHSGWVSAIAFSPDGRQIVSGSRDQTIKLWDTRTGDLQKTFTGHSSAVTAIVFSPDGKQIASGSDDQTIKLWDVTKALKASRLFGSRLGSRFKFNAWQEIKTSQTVDYLKFYIDGRHLATNLGLIKIEGTIIAQSPEIESLENLWVNNQWIYYGGVPVVLLPSDFQPQCYNVRDDQVTIGLRNGRILSFDINRMNLNSMIKNSA